MGVKVPIDAATANVEARVRAAFDAGDMAAATGAAIEGYGPEILGFLVAVRKDHAEAEEAFSLFAERLWQTMARFEWKCSARTWAYLIARRALADYRRKEGRHRRGRQTLSSSPVDEIAERVRTGTMSMFRTEKRTAIARLRDELPAEDRALLVLRINRALEWNEIARIMGAETDDLPRESARLRKRLQLVKERLRTLAKERGIL